MSAAKFDLSDEDPAKPAESMDGFDEDGFDEDDDYDPNPIGSRLQGTQRALG